MAASSFGSMPLYTPHTPGLDLYADQGPRIIGTCVVLIIISTIAVGLRFVARHLSQAGLWWDDWTILAALFFSYGGCICALAALEHGLGRHIEAVGNLLQRIEAASSWFKLFYAYETVYTVAVALAKYSILLFYSRIFTERTFKIALRITFALVTAWFIAVEITVLAECQPITSLWNFSEKGHCIDLNRFFLGAGIANVLLNTVILLLPLPMIWTLEIEKKHKLALSGVFMLGGFVVIVSIIRVVILARMQMVDFTWEFVEVGIWTCVEPAIAVCSACLPILRSLWIWNRRKGGTSRNRRSSRRSASHNSIRKHPDKAVRIMSGQSRYPLNELPGDAEHGWTRDEICSEHPPSSDNSNPDYQVYAKPDLKDPDSNYSTKEYYEPASIGHSRSTSDNSRTMTALPIQKEDRPSSKLGPEERSKSRSSLDAKPSRSPRRNTPQRAELYG